MNVLKNVVLGVCLAGCCYSSLAVAPVPTELVHFASGQVLAIEGHHVEGETAALTLRGGGEVLFDARLIDRVQSVTSLPPLPPPPPPRAVAPRPLPETPHAALIRDAADQHGLADTLLHALIEVESSYRADAESPLGAKGLMQLMPDILVRYGVRDPFDPATNIDAGARYLRGLLDEFGIRGGLAAYNAGAGSVRKFGGVPPYPETHRFVERVLRIVDAAR